MVQVPLYGGDNVSQVKLTPDNQARINLNVNADMFGASVGRGLQNLGAGIRAVSDGMKQVQDEMDKAAARKASAEFDRDMQRFMLDPDTGLLNTQGMNAADAAKRAEKYAEETAKKFSATLAPGPARDMFMEAATKSGYDNTALAMRHEAKEKKSVIDQSFVSVVDTAGENAVAYVGDDRKVGEEIGKGLNAIDERARLNGWDAATTANLKQQFTSDTQKKIIYSLAMKDPIAANAYYEKNKDQITGPMRTEIEAALREPMAAKQAAEDAANYFRGVRPAQKSGNAVENVGQQAVPSGNPAVTDGTQQPAAPSPAGPVAGASDIPPEGIALLNTIAGVESPGYNVMYTGRRFSSYAQHPNVRIPIRSGVNQGKYSTAAGRYQFIKSTWDEAAKALGLTDFSPANQDKAAWWLAQRDYRARTGRDLGEDLRAGNYSMVRKNLAATWEGLQFDTDAKFSGRMQKSGGALPSGNLTVMQDPIAGINDYIMSLPEERREPARKAIMANIEAMNKQRDMIQDQAKQGVWEVVNRGGSVDSIPIEIRDAAGLETVSAARRYLEQQGEIKTDQELKYNLDQMRGEDPDEFARQDLRDFQDRLSKEDFAELSKAQSAIKGDNREAREKELDIIAAQRQTETQLEAAGIMKPLPSAGEEARKEYAQRVNTFNAELAAEMRRFQQINGKPPSQLDIQQITSKLLMPIVMKQAGALGGMFGDNKVEGFAFERNTGQFRGQTTMPDYEQILTQMEPSMQAAIVADLRKDLGREPTEDEIAKRYVYLVSIFNTVDTKSPKDQVR